MTHRARVALLSLIAAIGPRFAAATTTATTLATPSATSAPTKATTPTALPAAAPSPSAAPAAAPTANATTPEAFIARGMWKKARALVQPLEKTADTDARVTWLLSQIRLAFGDPEAALALAEKAVAIKKDVADYHAQLASVSAGLARNSGMFRGMKLGLQMRREAEAAIAIDPRHVRAKVLLAAFYWNAPGMVGGDKDKARAIDEEILALDRVEGLLAKAERAVSEKDMAGAESFYRQGVEVTPPSYRARMMLASFCALGPTPRLAETEKWAREALSVDPERAAAYGTLAAVLANQEKLEDLDKLLADEARLSPDSLLGEYQAGRALLDANKDAARAERHLRKYMTQEPEGNTPSLAHAHWRLSQALEREGRKPEAISELETALKLKPDLEEAKKDLKRLK